MIIVLLVMQLILIVIWLGLSKRLKRSRLAISRLLASGVEGGYGLEQLAETIGDAVQRGWALEQEGEVLSMPVPDREPQDPYNDLGGVLAFVAGGPGSGSLSGIEHWLKGLFQLQEMFDLSWEIIQANMEEVLQHIIDGNSDVSSYELVRPGALIDRRLMWPMGQGTRVMRPLGAVLINRDGRVISRAKVVVR